MQIKKLEEMNKNRVQKFLPVFLVLFLFTITYVNGQSYVPERGNRKMVIKPEIKINAYAFNLEDVKLLESPFKNAMQADVSY